MLAPQPWFGVGSRQTTSGKLTATGRETMNLNRILLSFTLAAAAGVLTLAAPSRAQQPAAVAIDNDDIGGVVTGPNGPEAGVWVIAETTELPTKFAKIVVTDDQGRYVIPDLPPNVNYAIWVRGYGLVDSPKLRAKPGQQVNLTAVPAPNDGAAAPYFPGLHLDPPMKIPPAKGFGRPTQIPQEVPQHNMRRARDQEQRPARS